jgi:hypothetical protein
MPGIIQQADALAEALRALVEECNTNDHFAREHGSELAALQNAENELAAYERASVERVARDQFGKRMFSRQHR